MVLSWNRKKQALNQAQLLWEGSPVSQDLAAARPKPQGWPPDQLHLPQTSSSGCSLSAPQKEHSSPRDTLKQLNRQRCGVPTTKRKVGGKAFLTSVNWWINIYIASTSSVNGSTKVIKQTGSKDDKSFIKSGQPNNLLKPNFINVN